MARMLDKYRQEIQAAMMEKYGYKNRLAVPRIEKIVVSMGVGRAVENRKVLDAVAKDLSMVTGQKPLLTRAKKSVSGFKLRQGMPIGCVVTLRGRRMYEFMDRLVSVVIPRIRDFRGLNPEGFDGRGNYNMGLKEQIIFPEIVYDKVDKVRGMDITMVTTAGTDEEAKALLAQLGVPFRES
jgi:large subunit ribosomal protein L5